MERLSENTCWTPAEDLGHQKGQEGAPRNQGVQRKTKKKSSRTGPAPLGGRSRHGRRDQPGQKGSFGGSEENAATGP